MVMQQTENAMPSSNPTVNQATRILNTYLNLIQLGTKTVADLRALLQTRTTDGVSWADAINNDLWGIELDTRLRGAPMVQALTDEVHAAQTLPLLVRAGGNIAQVPRVIYAAQTNLNIYIIDLLFKFCFFLAVVLT